MNKQLKRSFSEKIRSFFMMETTKKAKRSIFNSLWAVVFGLLISCLFIAVFYQLRPATYLFKLFKAGATKTKDELWKYLIIYGITSLGVGFSFKAGLFNIGASGQMMMGGITSLLILGKYLKGGTSGGNDGIGFLIMLAAMLAGFIYAAIAGFLKAYFKIHEVVSTILLNWIAVYIGQFLFSAKFDIKKLGMPGNESTTSAIFDFTGNIFNSKNIIIFGMVVFILLVLSLFFMFRYTSLGYKIKMNGINKDASSYAGVNQKLTTILSLGFSGALSGLAGFIFFLFKEKKYMTGELTQPLGIGFDTISISLLGLNNPIGIVFSSTFYAILKNGTVGVRFAGYATSKINDGGVEVIIGIIIYTAALSSSFSTFQPIKWFRMKLAQWTQKSYKSYKTDVYDKKIKEINEKNKTLLAKAKEVQNKNKEEYKKILNQIKTLDLATAKLIREQARIQQEIKKYETRIEKLSKNSTDNNQLEEIKKNLNKLNKKALSAKEVEQIFANLSKKKHELGSKLAEHGYYEVKDIKAETRSKKIQLKQELTKRKNLAYERYMFRTRILSDLIKIHHGVSVINNSKLANDIYLNTLLEQREGLEILDDEYEKLVEENKIIFGSYGDYKSIQMMKFYQEISNLKQLKKTGLSLEKLTASEKKLNELKTNEKFRNSYLTHLRALAFLIRDSDFKDYTRKLIDILKTSISNEQIKKINEKISSSIDKKVNVIKQNIEKIKPEVKTERTKYSKMLSSETDLTEFDKFKNSCTYMQTLARGGR